MYRVLIFGKRGFISRSLSSSLVANGISPHTVSSLQACKWGQGAEASLHFQDVIYLPYFSDGDVFSTNLGLLKFALTSVSWDSFTFISSGGKLYGERQKPASEQEIADNLDLYGQVKLAQEKLLDEFRARDDLRRPIVSLRLTNPYGAGQMGTDRQGFIAALLVAGRSGSPLRLYGDGMQVRDFLHFNDFFNLYSLTKRNSFSGSVNAGYGSSVALLEVIDIYEKLSGTKVSIEHVGNDPGLISPLIDVSLARSMGWTPQINLRRGLKELIQISG